MQSRKKWTNCWKMLVKGIVLRIYILHTVYLDCFPTRTNCTKKIHYKSAVRVKELNLENGDAMFRIFLFESLCTLFYVCVQWEMSLKPKQSLHSYMLDVECSQEMWENEKSYEVTKLITVSFFPLLL